MNISEGELAILLSIFVVTLINIWVSVTVYRYVKKYLAEIKDLELKLLREELSLVMAVKPIRPKMRRIERD